MFKVATASGLVLVLALCIEPSIAGAQVPFKGQSTEQAISAVPTSDPNVVLVTTVGSGQATHLGHFTFVSPHLSGLLDFSISGQQIFTAADGDTLTANIAGQLHPENGLLVGTITGTIVSGTGRFAGATGSYSFSIVFDPATFISTGMIDGTIDLNVPKK
jgi:hypothetical protein